MERKGRFTDTFGALPLAHQVVIGIAAAVLGMAAYLFWSWAGTPSYTVLYANLDDAALATVVQELDRQGVDYQVGGGGSRILVPKSSVYRIRAELTSAGVQTGTAPQGYEILDGQGLNVSNFRQRVDYQRALEGELSKTLMAMRAINGATVRLVIPAEALFQEDEESATASVLIDTSGPLTDVEVETITFLVASSVEGLKAEDVTVADVDGQVLQAAGQLSASSAVSNRNLRMTRDYEAALSADVRQLLSSVVGDSAASVVVRAELDFDETSTESESYAPETAQVTREATLAEIMSGSGTPPAGTLGVDGSEVPTATSDEYSYSRDEVTREYGIDRVVTKTTKAPGAVKSLSVAVILDDGSLTGNVAADPAEVQQLVTAALGIDETRGDAVAVSSMSFPAPVEVDPAAETVTAAAATGDIIPQAVGGVVMLLVVVALLLMTRGGKSKGSETVAATTSAPAGLPGGGAPGGEPSALAAIGASSGEVGMQTEVLNLVQRQPEEIAMLLRGWLADRR
jgi:flagellar M-ring protein FliF